MPRQRTRALVRILAREIKAVHKDLLAFQAKTEQNFEKVNSRFDKIDGRLDKHDGRFDRLEKEVRDLRKDMPGIVSSAMREVDRERRGKSRKTP